MEMEFKVCFSMIKTIFKGLVTLKTETRSKEM